jgi:hypothetical protein
VEDSPVAGAPFGKEFLYPAGKVAMDRGDFALAASLFAECARQDPDNVKVFINLGYCRFRLGRHEEVIPAMRRAVELDPTRMQSAIMLGEALHCVGLAEEGTRVLQEAVRLSPRNTFEQTVLGLTLLTLGRYEAGWPTLEARWDTPRLASTLPFVPSPTRPLWRGEPAPDRRLCVHGEGGYGDNLMCARFLPEIATRVGELIVIVAPPLERLLRDIEGVETVVTRQDRIPEGALHTSFFSLPAHVGLTLADLSGEPYLRPPIAGPELGERRAKLRIGLVWAGNRVTTHDWDRSSPGLEPFAPLLAMPDVEWISLQYGERAEEGRHTNLRPLPPVEDFADTAYVLSQLDLVVAVDTAVAHLAGALGIPTCIILPSMPEFRWGISGDRSAWYRSVKLFRRAHSRDWHTPIAKIRAEIERLRSR